MTLKIHQVYFLQALFQVSGNFLSTIKILYNDNGCPGATLYLLVSDCEGSTPTFHGGSPRNSLQSDIFLFNPWNIYLSDECSLLLICYLTCSCHQRNDQLSASWQDYLDTSYRLLKLQVNPIIRECIGSTSGH